MIGYKHPCRYCNQLVPPQSNTCPHCGKINPLQLRCPQCRSPIQEGWKLCSSCGLALQIKCPQCGEPTFFSDYCQYCDGRLALVCSNRKCRKEQLPINGNCNQCGKPLEKLS